MNAQDSPVPQEPTPANAEHFKCTRHSRKIFVEIEPDSVLFRDIVQLHSELDH